MTKLRCFAFTPDFRFAFVIQAPWWSNKAPQCWGLPANQYWPSAADDIQDFTPTGGKH